jgi:hypothetical protein
LIRVVGGDEASSPPSIIIAWWLGRFLTNRTNVLLQAFHVRWDPELDIISSKFSPYAAHDLQQVLWCNLSASLLARGCEQLLGKGASSR